jgi:hypothetical protein
MNPINGQNLTCPSDEAHKFREPASGNSYPLVPVETRGKNPVHKGWQNGVSREALLSVQASAANTGMLCRGFRVVDLDIDDPKVVLELLPIIQSCFPDGAIWRRRENSARMAIIYRAAEGQPKKRKALGAPGKIEILGAGQQVVVHGVHPSGASLYWYGGRGPHNVPLMELPAVSEAQIDAFFEACRPLGFTEKGAANDAVAGDVLGFDPAMLPTQVTAAVDPIPDRFGANLEAPRWFGLLPPTGMSAVLKACLGAVDNTTTDPYEQWRNVLFSAAHAQSLGCPGARELALEWSQRGAGWNDEDAEDAFDGVWNSFKPDKPGGITVATLLKMGSDAGADFSPFRGSLESIAPPAAAPAAGVQTAPQVAPAWHSRAVDVSALRATPPPREWLHGVDLARGFVTLIAGAGGVGKSGVALVMGLACASGKRLLDGKVLGKCLRVLHISAEDGQDEMERRVAAARKQHGLAPSDVPGWRMLIAPRELFRTERGMGVPDEVGWRELRDEVAHNAPDILIIDPVVSVLGGANVNDNSTMGVFMRRLTELAGKHHMSVVLIHHVSKGRDLKSAEAVQGASALVNLSRIVRIAEPLAAEHAGKIGLRADGARHVFRLGSAKANLAPLDPSDRWFMNVGVALGNGTPDYPNGDTVGVPVSFVPSTAASPWPPAAVTAALKAIDEASPPLSDNANAKLRFAGPAILGAITPHLPGNVIDADAKAILDYLRRGGLVDVVQGTFRRGDGRNESGKILILTPAGKQSLAAEAPEGATVEVVEVVEVMPNSDFVHPP